MSKQNTIKKSQTDWARIDAMTDDEIDYSDIPPITDEMWKAGVLRKGLKPTPKKAQENFPIDIDIIEYFKSQGQNYRVKINQLLREYMEAHPVK